MVAKGDAKLMAEIGAELRSVRGDTTDMQQLMVEALDVERERERASMTGATELGLTDLQKHRSTAATRNQHWRRLLEGCVRIPAKNRECHCRRECQRRRNSSRCSNPPCVS